MLNGTLYEKNRSRDRYLALISLAVFTVVSALISLLVMDILVFPLALFAVKYKNIYNFIIRDLTLVLLGVLLVTLLAGKIIRFRKEGNSFRAIAGYLIKRPLSYLSAFFFLLFVSVVIILFLYLVLNGNYSLLSKITGG